MGTVRHAHLFRAAAMFFSIKTAKKCIAFCLASSIFLTIGAWQMPAQAPTKDPFSDPKNTEKLIDGYITVMTMAYPPAGGALAAAKGLMSMLGFFNKPDLVAAAIKELTERLDALETRVDKLEREIVSTRNEGRENANLVNINEIRRLRDELEDVMAEFSQKPTTEFAKSELTRKAERVARRMLEDKRLWEWSDQAVKDHVWEGQQVKAGTFLARDFKPMPTLEMYQTALAAWMATIEYASGSRKDVVQSKYGQELRRHIEYLKVRPNWNELNGVPQTLPEMIKSRVSSEYVPTSRTPDQQQVCVIAEYLTDSMARKRVKIEKAIEYVARSRNELCNVPANMASRASAKEIEVEDAYGADSMAFLAGKMEKLLQTGSLAEQVIARFDTNTQADDFQLLYTVSQDGTLTWHRHVMRFAKGTTRATHSFNPPKTIGSGWAGGVKKVMPMGQLGIYTLWEDGRFSWYWHQGAIDGSYNWAEPPLELAKDLRAFKEVIAQDKGVFYTMLPDGRLLWNMTSSYDARRGKPKIGGGMPISNMYVPSFLAFKTVFGGGNGVLYAIGHDGKLYWMRHNLYLSPTPYRGPVIPGTIDFDRQRTEWTPPIQIGTGFQNVSIAFSPGEGHFYYVDDSGNLIWRRHTGWEKGTNSWDANSGTVIARGWNQYKFAFARNTTSDAGSGNPAVDIVVR